MRKVRMVSAGELCFGILYNDFHRPLVDGKANRDRIEDAVTIGMMKGELGYVDADTVRIAISLIDDLLEQQRSKTA